MPCLEKVVGITHTHRRGVESYPFFYLGYVWLGYGDRKMYRKVRSIPCGKIFELRKATVLSKFLVPYDNLPITIKRPPKQ